MLGVCSQERSLRKEKRMRAAKIAFFLLVPSVLLFGAGTGLVISTALLVIICILGEFVFVAKDDYLAQVTRKLPVVEGTYESVTWEEDGSSSAAYYKDRYEIELYIQHLGKHKYRTDAATYQGVQVKDFVTAYCKKGSVLEIVRVSSIRPLSAQRQRVA
jgi:hypothetical protein